MKRQTIGRIIKAAVFLALVLAVTSRLGYIFSDKTSQEYIATFNDLEKNSVDVLFLGSSHIYRTISPMELWHRQGIASFNLGTSEQSLAQSYWALQWAFETQAPKLVVLETYMAKQSSLYVSLARMHQAFDSMPLSLVKIRALSDMLPVGDQVEFYWKMYLYHFRWKDIVYADTLPISSVWRGADYNYGTKPIKIPAALDKTRTGPIPENALIYLNRIIALCKQKNIPLLLFTVPYNAAESDMLVFNSINCVTEADSVPYLDGFALMDAMGLDMNRDFSDSGHFNAGGAFKVTEFLGRYIRDNYDIPDRSGDPGYSAWNADYKQYRKELLVQETDIIRYAALLDNPDYVALIAAKDDASKKINTDIRDAFAALGLDFDLAGHYQWSYIAVVDGGQKRAEFLSEEALDYSDHPAGSDIMVISQGHNTGNTAAILVNGTETSLNRQGLNITVLDKATGQVLDMVSFNTYYNLTCYR
jgi:hypothetical protein